MMDYPMEQGPQYGEDEQQYGEGEGMEMDEEQQGEEEGMDMDDVPVTQEDAWAVIRCVLFCVLAS